MPDMPESAVAPDRPETAIDEVIAAIPTVVKESKAGYKTTEFWVTIAISGLTVLGGIPMPDKYNGLVVAALGAAYALSRGIAKKGIPAIEPVVPEA
jgi:hypothetical protein